MIKPDKDVSDGKKVKKVEELKSGKLNPKQLDESQVESCVTVESQVKESM